MMIDIRDEEDGTVTQIKFDEPDGDLAAMIVDNYSQLRLADLEGLGDNRIEKSAIPNLIKALQKAQELWG